MRPELCSAARALLGFTQDALSKKTELGRQSINGYEVGGRRLTNANKAYLEMMFREYGIEFFYDEDANVFGLTVTNPEKVAKVRMENLNAIREKKSIRKSDFKRCNHTEAG